MECSFFDQTPELVADVQNIKRKYFVCVWIQHLVPCYACVASKMPTNTTVHVIPDTLSKPSFLNTETLMIKMICTAK